MLRLQHAAAERPRVERVLTQRVRRDLAVQDLGDDVGVVRRRLPQPLAPSSVSTRTNATHSFAYVSMRRIRTARRQKVMTLRSVAPLPEAATASLMSCSPYVAVTSSSSRIVPRA